MPAPGSGLEGKIRSCTKVMVNGKSETLWSNYTSPATYKSPEPQDLEQPEEEVDTGKDKLPVVAVDHQKLSAIGSQYVSLFLLVLVVILGGLVSVIIGYYM